MKEQNITVALRVRPINPKEVRSGAIPIARAVDKNVVVLMDPNRDSDDILRAKRAHDHHYKFDIAFGSRTTQREVYQQTSQGLISKVIDGYNATVFAYGPTGAGKTYTMLGRADEPGIMGLTLTDLFTKMEENKEHSQYHVTMAYLEIYNETVRDLLDPSVGLLDLREDAHGATIVSGLTEIEVKDTEEVMRLLNHGNIRRTCEPTAVNRTSSRSHAILKVTVEQQSRVMNICQKIRTGVLFMVDLAGSERAANTQNRGQRMKEGAHINRSLLALANCINTLCSGGNYVNYRDSKLTRLLKDALSGNCLTVMIAHISPASNCFEESKNTLKYANRVKHLKTKVSSNIGEVNHTIIEYEEIMKTMKKRIHELEQEKKMAWRRRGEGEGASLCGELRILLQKEKEIRQEMVCLEHQLLLIAIERQKHMATIQQSEGTSSLSPSLLSPLPTTLEDTGQSSLLFERSSNCFAVSSYMIQPSQSISDFHIQSQNAQDIEMSHDNHVTTAETARDSPETTNELSHDNHVTTTELSHDNHMSEPLTSPDSGLPSVDAVPKEDDDDVQVGEEAMRLARDELAVLMMDRRRTEARHRRLGRKLMEIRTKKSQLQEHMSDSDLLSSHQSELCVALQLCGDMEEEMRQRELAAARATLQLDRRESTLEGLLELNTQLVTALQQYRALLDERAVSLPPSLPPLEPLVSQCSSLSRQVKREERLPVTGRTLQLPTFAAFSARLCTTATTAMAGSKSNLLVEDVTTDGELEEEETNKLSATSTVDISDIRFPTLMMSSLPQESSPHLSPSPSLPPLPHTTSLITPHTLKTHTHTSHSTIFPNSSMPAVLPFPSSQSNFISSPHSKEGLPSKEDTRLSGSTAVDTAVQPPKRTSARTILSKVVFNGPRISVSRSSGNKTKYVYNPTTLVEEDDNDATTDVDTVMSSTQPDLHLPCNERMGNVCTSTGSMDGAPVETTPVVTVPGTQPEKREGRGKELQLQSLSQLSLSGSTPVRVKREEAVRMGKRLPQSSIPVVKNTEQGGRAQPIRSLRKPPHSMPVLQKKKAKERRPFIPSKVIAGSHLNKVASPYLHSPSKSKSGVKRAGPKKTTSTHLLTKLGKSPYHIPMAKTNKSKK